MSKIIVLNNVVDSVIKGEIEACKETVTKALEMGLDPLEIIEEGLTRGIKEVGDRFRIGEYFLYDLAIGGEAMMAGMEILEPIMLIQKKKMKRLGRVLIGTVAGDVHDIGKNIVGIMLTAHGFEVIDLGTDVKDEVFISKIKELKPDILGLSALLTHTMQKQRDVINALKKSGFRDKVKVMVGGGAVNEEWAQEIGADAYGVDALETVSKAKKLLIK